MRIEKVISLVCCFLLLGFYSNAQQIKKVFLVMRTTGTHILWDNESVVFYGFADKLWTSPTLPGKTIYVNEGDSVNIEVYNFSQVPHTVHLHGLDVNTENDGDPMTSFHVDHRQDTTYSFKASHAGTYIYHCHYQDVLHVQLGMYGLLVVRPADSSNTAWTNGPAYDKEYAWLMSEIDKKWFEGPHESHAHSSSHPPYKPEYFLINGKSKQQLKEAGIEVTGTIGQKIYVRLANIGYYINKVIFPASLNATVIDSDGRPLPGAIKSDTVEVFPGERYGVMLTPSEEMLDSISVQYINMNNKRIGGTENVNVSIGFPNSINKKNLNLFSLFPNPASEFINIKLSGNSKNNDLLLFNSMGQVVKEYKLQGVLDEQALSLEGIESGIYFLSLKEEGYFFKKIVVQKNK